MPWEVKKLGDVLSIERGGSPRPIKKYLTKSPEGINWIKISDATVSEKYIYETKEKITRDGLHKTRVVNEGDFILSNSMSFGRPYIMKTSGCIHDGWLVLKQTNKKVFETEFLYFLLSSPYVFQQFNYLAAGSTVRNLNIALVSSVEVPTPPLPEQKRIVAILDEAFKSIAKAKESAEKNLKNAKEIFDSYLHSVFENKGEEWEEEKLGEVCEVIAGQSPEGKYYNNCGKGLPFYQGKKEFTDKLIGDPTTWTTKTTKEAKTKDILMSVRAPVGPINFSTQNICIGRGLAAIRAGKMINNEFLYNFLLKIQKELVGNNGAVFNSINKNQIENIKIFHPSLEEQQVIVTKLDKLSKETKKLESIYNQKLISLNEVKQSILQKAFKGELTEGSA